MNVHQKKVAPSSDDLATPTRPDGPSQAYGYDNLGGAHTGARRTLNVAGKVILPLLVLGLGGLGYAYLTATRPEPKKRPAVEQVYAVKAAVAKPQTVQPKIKLYGTTVSGRRVDIRALVSGRVVETSPALREGGTIDSGAMLLHIDPFSYEQGVAESTAQLAEAEARVAELRASIATDEASLAYAKEQMTLAKTDLDRAVPLARRGTVSQRTVDERQQTLLQRQQSVDQLVNSIKVWDAKVAQQEATINRLQASRDLARRRLEETTLVAPFNAVVADVTSHVGRMVGANDKVATLIDRDWIEARFSLSDEQYGRILSGSKPLEDRDVDVIWSIGRRTLTYPATIERVGAEVSASSGGVDVFARLKDPSSPVPLRSGAFVEVIVPDKTFVDVVRVEATALYGGDHIYIIESGRLAERKVDVVGSVGNDLLIKGDIKENDRILVTRISTPGEGVRVREVE